MRLILQTKKRSIVGVLHQYLHSGVELVNCSFSNIINIIQCQGIWKMRLMCHLKHSLGLQRKRRPWTLNHDWPFFYKNKATAFFYSRLSLNLILQTRVVTIEKLNTTETYQYTSIQEFGRLDTKSLQIIALFLLKFTSCFWSQIKIKLCVLPTRNEFDRRNTSLIFLLFLKGINLRNSPQTKSRK